MHTVDTPLYSMKVAKFVSGLSTRIAGVFCLATLDGLESINQASPLGKLAFAQQMTEEVPVV